MRKPRRFPARGVAIALLCVLLAACVGYILTAPAHISYLQDKDEVYKMACGILKNCQTLREGETAAIAYDFHAESFDELAERYTLSALAGKGTELERALRLMNHFSPRLKHNGNFTEYRPEMNALALLDYALGQPRRGIHCRAKAQIFNEMFLSQRIYSRKLWICPLSVYDNECHVVNEIWDTGYHKWVMLDTTNNLYWVDENGAPLSALEVRGRLAEQAFVTPAQPGDPLTDLNRLREKYESFVLYTAKNMAYLQCFLEFGEGEAGVVYALLPEAMTPWDSCLISEEALLAPPVAD